MVKAFAEPPPVEIGDRAPDGIVHDSEGRQVRLHDLFGRSFVALYFTDTRRRPDIPVQRSALAHALRRVALGCAARFRRSATARCSTPVAVWRTAMAARPTPWSWCVRTTTLPRSQPMSPGLRAGGLPGGSRQFPSGRRCRRDDHRLLPFRRRRDPDHRRGQRHRRGACAALRARRRHRDCRRPAARRACSAQLEAERAPRIDVRKVDVSDEAAVAALIGDVKSRVSPARCRGARRGHPVSHRSRHG